MDEAFKKELIEHCKRQMQRFERMGRTDSSHIKNMLFYLVFLNVHIYIFNTTIVMIDDKKVKEAAMQHSRWLSSNHE